MTNMIENLIKDTAFSVVEINSDTFDTCMEEAWSLSDDNALIVSTPTGWIHYEHLILDEALHVLVARSFEEGDYAGCAIDFLNTKTLDDFFKGKFESAYWISSNKEAFQKFILDIMF